MDRTCSEATHWEDRVNRKSSDDTYSEQETAQRRDANIKQMLSTLPERHGEMKIGERKTSSRKAGKKWPAKSPLSRSWRETPWGMLWGMAIFVMIAAFVLAILDGFSIGKAIVWAILCGPGWLAALSILGLIISFFRLDQIELHKICGVATRFLTLL